MHGHEIHSDILCVPPMITDSGYFQKLLEKFELFHVCPGHVDKQSVVEVVKSRNRQLLNSSDEVAAYLECGYPIMRHLLKLWVHLCARF